MKCVGGGSSKKQKNTQAKNNNMLLSLTLTLLSATLLGEGTGSIQQKAHTEQHQQERIITADLTSIAQSAKVQGSISCKFLKGMLPSIVNRKLHPLKSVYLKGGLPLETIFSREIEHARNYAVFYHGHHGSVRIIQDLFGGLNNFLQAASETNFVYFRDPISSAGEICEEGSIANDDCQRRNRLKPYRRSFDGRPHIQKQLLSVNVHLFANMYFGDYLESTMTYYSANFSQDMSTDNRINQFLDDYDLKLNASAVSKIKSLAAQHGNLLQIFIPKDKVDDCVYIARPGGTPLNDPCYWRYMDRIKPSDIDQGVQARIILSTKTMIDCKHGAKIFRYTPGSPEETEQYDKLLKHAVDEMLIEWLERMKTGSVKAEALERIYKTTMGRKILTRCWRTSALVPQIDNINTQIIALKGQWNRR